MENQVYSQKLIWLYFYWGDINTLEWPTFWRSFFHCFRITFVLYFYVKSLTRLSKVSKSYDCEHIVYISLKKKWNQKRLMQYRLKLSWVLTISVTRIRRSSTSIERFSKYSVNQLAKALPIVLVSFQML